MNAPIADISKFLDGTLDVQKTDALEHWREASPENEKYFQEMVYVWNSSSTATKNNTDILTIDTEKALDQVNSKINSAKVVKLKPRFNFLAIASSLAILVAAIFTFQHFNNSVSAISIAANGVSGQEVILPDESTIWLEPGSSISYMPSFSDGRNVSIEGEVFVDVVPNKNSPFIVQSPNMTTEVLGTSFVVYDKKNENNSHVTVLSGKVKVSSVKTNKHVLLSKDMTAVYNANSLLLDISKTVRSANHLFAATKQLRFSETTLSELFKQLESFTQSSIKLDNDAIANCAFTGHFKTNDIAEILQRIQPIYNFTIRNNSGNYSVSGGSCN